MVHLQFTDDPNIRNMIGAQAGDDVAVCHENNHLSGYCHFLLKGDCLILRDLRHESNDLELAEGLVRLVAAHHPECTYALCENRGLLAQVCAQWGMTVGEQVLMKQLLETNCPD